MRYGYRIPFLVACLSSVHLVSTFWLATRFLIHRHHHRKVVAPSRSSSSRATTALASGYGIATNYTWKEEAYEVDVTVKVPVNTRAKDILFKATSQSIDLRLKTKSSGDEDDEPITLLDCNRKLRGRVNLDGTYWVISDPDDSVDHREVTVTIEKLIKTPKDDFEVVDYDWKGVYSTEDPGEVSERKYDKAEPLDVREYAANMGVDIDNINMSMVDKSMFSSGLNLTQNSLDELNRAGYLQTQEVTQQADGTEYIVNDEGEPVPFSPLGETIDTTAAAVPKPPVPFLDTVSPWHKKAAVDAVLLEEKPTTNTASTTTVVQQKRNFTRAAFAEDSAKQQSVTDNPFQKRNTAADPIDALTVQRLKEILKSQGIKSSGTKKELQDRLRSQVNSLLQGKQQDKE